MIKKTIITTAAILLAGVVLFGRNTLGYIRTSWGYVHDSVQNSVPVGFEIDHARQMIQDLVPEVRKNMHVIAKEEVEVQRLEEQIANSESKLAKDKEQILRLKTDLATAKDTYQYGGRNYTAAEVKTDLANRFERYKTAEATLASLKQVRDARVEEPGRRPAEARRHAGPETAVAGRSREPGGPQPDGRRRPDDQQLPVRRQPTRPRQGTGPERQDPAGGLREAGQRGKRVPGRDSPG